MLALGADAVLIGRPVAIAAIGGGREGVRIYLEQLYQEFSEALIITGTPSVDDISSNIIRTLSSY